jgi:hypothetical protein
MSTEEYPEVSGDESGIVPTQSARPPEWPKKIRTLTASELDRLTIDSSGRFYWDGKLVNYEPSESKAGAGESAESREQSAMDIIDRAAHDLSDHKAPSPIEGAALPGLHSPTEFDFTRVLPAASTTALPLDSAPAQMIRASDQLHLSLSRLQAVAVIVALLAFVTGAAGVAAYGYVAMRDWSCRIDSKQSNCPAVAVAKPIARPQIPE